MIIKNGLVTDPANGIEKITNIIIVDSVGYKFFIVIFKGNVVVLFI